MSFTKIRAVRSLSTKLTLQLLQSTLGTSLVCGTCQVQRSWICIGVLEIAQPLWIKSSDPIISTDIADGVFPDGQGLCPTIAIKGGHADDVSLDIPISCLCASRLSAD